MEWGNIFGKGWLKGLKRSVMPGAFVVTIVLSKPKLDGIFLAFL